MKHPKLSIPLWVNTQTGLTQISTAEAQKLAQGWGTFWWGTTGKDRRGQASLEGREQNQNPSQDKGCLHQSSTGLSSTSLSLQTSPSIAPKLLVWFKDESWGFFTCLSAPHGSPSSSWSPLTSFSQSSLLSSVPTFLRVGQEPKTSLFLDITLSQLSKNYIFYGSQSFINVSFLDHVCQSWFHL